MEAIGYDEDSVLYLFFDENGKLIGEGAQNANGTYSMNMLCVFLNSAEDRLDQYIKDAVPNVTEQVSVQETNSAE